MDKYPDIIYVVEPDGILRKKDMLSEGKHGKMKYRQTRLIDWPNDEHGWTEITEEDGMEKGYQEFSLDLIDKYLKGEAPYQYDNVWTLDKDKAYNLSQERFAEHYPTGRVYCVKQFTENWVNEEGKVIARDLLRSEAEKLAVEKLKASGYTLYYSIDKQDKE